MLRVSEANARLISLALRSGVEVQIVTAGVGIRCPHPMWQDGKQVLSCPDAIAQVLESMSTTDSALPLTQAARRGRQAVLSVTARIPSRVRRGNGAGERLCYMCRLRIQPLQLIFLEIFV